MVPTPRTMNLHAPDECQSAVAAWRWWERGGGDSTAQTSGHGAHCSVGASSPAETLGERRRAAEKVAGAVVRFSVVGQVAKHIDILRLAVDAGRVGQDPPLRGEDGLGRSRRDRESEPAPSAHGRARASARACESRASTAECAPGRVRTGAERARPRASPGEGVRVAYQGALNGAFHPVRHRARAQSGREWGQKRRGDIIYTDLQYLSPSSSLHLCTWRPLQQMQGPPGNF